MNRASVRDGKIEEENALQPFTEPLVVPSQDTMAVWAGRDCKHVVEIRTSIQVARWPMIATVKMPGEKTC